MTEELNLGELFENFVKFISRNRNLLTIVVLCGVVSVVAFQKLKPAYFETKAICMSGISEYERQEKVEDLSQRTATDLVNHLQINVENKDYGQLANLLGVDLDIAQTLKKIEAEQLYQQDMNEKFYALNKFEITLTLFDNEKINQVQDGLTFYFENNKFIMSYYEEYKKSCNSLINDINSEIESLASFREQSNSQLSLGLTNTLAGKNKSLSNEIIALSHVREDIIINKKLLKPFVFVQDFAKVEQKEDDVLLWGLLGAVLSFILGLFIALIKEVKTK